MVVEIRRFLGNTLSLHVHDADNESPNCRLGQIGGDHRRWYDTLEEARRDAPFDDCHWCMGGSNGADAGSAAAAVKPG